MKALNPSIWSGSFGYGPRCWISCDSRVRRRLRRYLRERGRWSVDREESTLTVGFPPSATFNKRKAEAPDKRDLVAAALEAVAGERLRPVYVVVDGEAGAEGPAGGEEMDEEELVERLKSEFDAEEVG